MKKIIILISFILCMGNIHAQVFSSGKLLRKGGFSLGLEPAYYTSGNNTHLFFHADARIKPGIALSLRLGAGNTNYFGGALEWQLSNIFYLTTGIHDFGGLALDGTIKANLPVRNDVGLFFGLDSDVMLEDNLKSMFWIPLGVEIDLKKWISLIFESGIGIKSNTSHIIAGGVNIYL